MNRGQNRDCATLLEITCGSSNFLSQTLFLLCTKPLSVASTAVQSRGMVLLFVTASIVCRFCVLLCVVVFTVLSSGAIVCRG